MASALLCGAFFTACDDNDEKPVFPENQENVYDMSGFAKGADVSWLTEMEKSGYKFYDAEGTRPRMHVPAPRSGNELDPPACMGKPRPGMV